MSKELVMLDGNEAAAHIAYDFTEIAAIYPITPSSPMAEHTDVWSARGRKNLFGQTVTLQEMQSEAGAIGAVHGALQTGALATTYTSSQGLMLMIPVLHRIAGERLPAVMHVAARTVGTHGMSIFGDHSDVMDCRATGFAQFSTGSVQEVVDLAAVAHLAAIESRVPFMHFFDGFRTSHELATVEMIDREALHALLNREALEAFRAHALNPEHPVLRNTVQNPDVYFQIREANNRFYDAVPGIVEKYLEQISAITGREYHLFNYYGAPDATDVIVAMGSVSGVARLAVDYLNANGKKVGYVQVHLYRPFSMEKLMEAIPATVHRVAVLDRCKEMGSIGEPLYQDVCTAVLSSGRPMTVIGGRYGLSSKDTDPDQILAVFRNLESENPVRGFTIGIEDDVTHLSLPTPHVSGVSGGKSLRCKFWGLGGDGTVGANKNTVQIVSEAAGVYAQAYFEYDAKKSFGVTKSHLRFSREPIRGSYYVKRAEFVACHNQSYLNQYDMVSELKTGGTFLLNSQWKPEELEQRLPADVKRILARKKIKFYMIDATDIALRLGLGSHTNTVLQAAFFAVTGIIPPETALERMKDAARKTYFAKGDEIIDRNVAAIEAGAREVREITVPESWAELPDTPNAAVKILRDALGTGEGSTLPDVVRKILYPINAQKGDDLPVSSFAGYEDGCIDMGLTAWEKRGIAVRVPKWDAEKCVQCNRCSLVCPHAVIRPYLLSDAEMEKAPAGFQAKPANGAAKGYHFALVVSDFDCTGCGSCAESCPAKALEMAPAVLTEDRKARWDYALTVSDKGDLFDRWSVKGSQFRQPLVEFSAACAGCGETPYAKLMTQLFGERVYWANGTGCSQAWGAPMPGIPYTTNCRGFGPAWTNSLFENNAELCLGMFLSVRQQRERVKGQVEALLKQSDGELKAACENYLAAYDSYDGSRTASDALLNALEGVSGPEAEDIRRNADQLARKSFWMYGGDGWAYDIGFGGLAHVIASGENVNVFVIDTEVYSNTGGQSSKATPIGAVAQFASAGKRSRKMDLGGIMMSYGNVYVAQVAMGADPNQLIKALKEAEEYEGPSVIVAYTPCTSHGIRSGMHKVQEEMKRAVESGYWLLYRYDPRKEHPLHLDSKSPKLGYEEFLDGETRYSALRRTFPDHAKELFAIGSDDAQKRYDKYRRMEETS
ncbi:MAG: pyruvate:ferredoxin (flavodoxin) oxidoreductase [Oscillospiraceae bacterium]|nr:pyruvate:ferredoxin (flavodoxin) oxidoreductase [Oscillospiraceae bacterium]